MFDPEPDWCLGLPDKSIKTRPAPVTDLPHVRSLAPYLVFEKIEVRRLVKDMDGPTSTGILTGLASTDGMLAQCIGIVASCRNQRRLARACHRFTSPPSISPAPPPASTSPAR